MWSFYKTGRRKRQKVAERADAIKLARHLCKFNLFKMSLGVKWTCVEGKLNSTAIIRKVSIIEPFVWKLVARASSSDKGRNVSNFLQAALALTPGFQHGSKLAH